MSAFLRREADEKRALLAARPFFVKVVGRCKAGFVRNPERFTT
jgi:hypothetical protein